MKIVLFIFLFAFSLEVDSDEPKEPCQNFINAAKECLSHE
jgi:hypothetical protein